MTTVIISMFAFSVGALFGTTFAVLWCLRKMDVMDLVQRQSRKAYDSGWTKGCRYQKRLSYDMGFIDGRASVDTLTDS